MRGIGDSLQEQGKPGIICNFGQRVGGGGHAPETGEGVGQLLDPCLICAGLDRVEQGLVIAAVQAGIGQGREVLVLLVVGGFLVGVVAFGIMVVVIVVPGGGRSLVVVAILVLLVILLVFAITTTTIIAAAKCGCRC